MDTLDTVVRLYADYMAEYMREYYRPIDYAYDAAVMRALCDGVITAQEADNCLFLIANI